MDRKGQCYNSKHHLYVPTDIEDGYDCYCINEESFNKHSECCDSSLNYYDCEKCKEWCKK